MIKYLVGVDEAGRGPLAGPVAVGAVMIPVDFDWNVIPGVTDSKKVSAKKRESIFLRAQELSKEGQIITAVALIAPKIIDTKGITHAVTLGIHKSLATLNPNPEFTKILLDGLLKAPEAFVFQETIIKGDAKEKVIGLASILAKVTRDQYMEKIAKVYPYYAFEVHKGYGTKAHRAQVELYGPCPEHRCSFMRSFLSTEKDLRT